MKVVLVGVCAVPSVSVVLISAAAAEKTLVLLAGFLACAVTVILALALVNSARFEREQVWPILARALGSLAIIFCVLVTHWPLRIAHLLSRSSFDRLALELRAGRQMAAPQWVGFFFIKKAEVDRNGIVCLWTNPHPGGNTGFVRCGPKRVPFNLWSMVKLDDTWQFISED